MGWAGRGGVWRREERGREMEMEEGEGGGVGGRGRFGLFFWWRGLFLGREEEGEGWAVGKGRGRWEKVGGLGLFLGLFWSWGGFGLCFTVFGEGREVWGVGEGWGEMAANFGGFCEVFYLFRKVYGGFGMSGDVSVRFRRCMGCTGYGFRDSGV